MTNDPRTLLLDVGPNTTAICDAPTNLKLPVGPYERQLAALYATFTRPTLRYNPMIKRMVPGTDVFLIRHDDNSFDTGILQYITMWWLNNTPQGRVVLVAEGGHTEITTSTTALSDLARFFRERSDLECTEYTHPKHLKITERDYLPRTIEAWLHYPRGIWQVATNGGKTYMLGALAGFLKTSRFLITVPHTRSALAIQGADAFKKMGHKDIAAIKGRPLSTRARIVWAATSTLTTKMSKDPENTLRWMNSFDILVKDECHEHSTKENWLYRNTTIWARLGMSGTPLRNNSVHDATTIGTFGPILHTVSNSDLIDRGVSKRPHVFILRIKHERERFPTYADFHSYIVNNRDRNKLIVRCAILLRSLGHYVVVSTPSINPHAQTLTNMLQTYGETDLYDGTQTPQQRSDILNRLATRKSQFLVASRVFDVGVSEDCITAIIFAGPVGKQTAHVTLLQKAGRGLRRSDETAQSLVIVDLQDITQFGTGQAQRRTAVWKKDAAFALQTVETEFALREQLINHCTGVEDDQ